MQFNEDAVIQVNFDLKSRVKPESFKLYAVADVQIGYESDVTDWQANILPDMIDLASGLGNDAYGISLGDIIWNAPDMYPTYVQTITKVPVPSSPLSATTTTTRKQKAIPNPTRNSATPSAPHTIPAISATGTSLCSTT